MSVSLRAHACVLKLEQSLWNYELNGVDFKTIATNLHTEILKYGTVHISELVIIIRQFLQANGSTSRNHNVVNLSLIRIVLNEL
jgi:hypothetical protein